MDEGSNDGRNALAGPDLDLRVWRRDAGRYAQPRLRFSMTGPLANKLRDETDAIYRDFPEASGQWMTTVRRER